MKTKTKFALCSFVLAISTTTQLFSQQYYQGQPTYQPYPQQAVHPQMTLPNQVQPNQGVVQNQHWSQSLGAEQRHHDFGVVPSFSDQQHVFEFKNNLAEKIHLIGVRASCGCTKPSIVTTEVEPGGTGKVLAKFDTRNFKGGKKATVSVTVRKDLPYTDTAEIQFSVKGKIRRDVVLNPGTVSFADITAGEAAKRTVEILYAGNPQWRIEEIKSTNKNIKIESQELQRQGNRVDYMLTVQLTDNQAVGAFLDQIQIVTNDATNRNLAINVQGNVKSVVQVSPVRLGVLSKDQPIEKRLIVRGARPFEIKTVSASDSRIKFNPSEGSKTLHILTYRLDTSAIGQINSKITIETDDPEQAMATVPFEAQVVPATFALDQQK